MGDVSAHHLVALCIELLQGRRVVAPSADVEAIALLSVPAHAEEDEESLVPTRLAGLHFQGETVAVCAVIQACQHLGSLHQVGQCGGLSVLGHADVLVVGLGFPGAQADGAAAVFHTVGRDGGGTAGDVVRRSVLGIHLLHVVGGASHHLIGVNPDEVGGPFAVVHILEERCVGGHGHQVAVALHARDEGSLRESRVHVAASDSLVAGIFAHIHLPFAALLGVKQGGIAVEEVGCHVPVGVNHVGLLDAAVLFAQAAHVIIDERQLGILLLDGLVEDVEAAVILGPPVLIAYLYILQGEGFGMTILCTQGAPFGIQSSNGILDGIHTVVQVGGNLALRRGIAHAELASQAHVADEHHLGSYIFAVLKNLVIAHAVGATVAPCAVLAGPCGGVSQGLLPVEAVGKRNTLDHTAPRPAEEGRLQVGQALGNVLPHAIVTVVECGGEE